MKQTALALSLLVVLQLFASCTARPEEEIPPVGDSITTHIPGPGPDTTTAPAPAGPRANSDPTRENYILRSDTAWIKTSGDLTTLTVRGPLGNGCQKYEYMDSVRKGTSLELRFWASRPKDPNVICTELMQAFSQEIRIENSPNTEYKIMQPNGTSKSVSSK